MDYYLQYTIGNIKFATPIEELKEIVRPKEIRKAENLGKNLVGFFYLREKKVLLYDLSNFLAIEDKVNKFEVIIVEIAPGYIGFKVSKVLGIIAAKDLIPFPELVRSKDYFKGVIKDDGSFLQVLSFSKLLSGPRLGAIKKYL